MRKHLRGFVYYIFNFWNFIDVLTPSLVLYTTISKYISQNYLEPVNTYEAYVMSLTHFILWLRSIYFLRIFGQSGYLVRMIINVIYDVKIFTLIFIISLAAFADPFFVLANS